MEQQAELTHLKSDEPLEDVLEVLNTDGAVIVEECFSGQLIEQILSELAPHIEKSDSNKTHINQVIADFYGEHTRHVTGLCSKSPTFVAEVLLHPLMLGVADAVLGPSCADYQLNVAHMLVLGPGAEAQFPPPRRRRLGAHAKPPSRDGAGIDNRSVRLHLGDRCHPGGPWQSSLGAGPPA